MLTIVIGVTGGIGGAIHSMYNEACYPVIGTSREKGHLFELDVRDYDSCKEIAQGFRKQKLHVINCTGINRNGKVKNLSHDDWQDVIDTNLTGSYNLLKAFIPIMEETGYGRMMFLSSVVARGLPGAGAYAASKAGMEGLIKATALEVRGDITVNALRLGYYPTGLIRDVSQDFLDTKVLPHTQGKFCSVGRLFGLIQGIFSCGDVNGSVIDVNRGL